MRIAFVQFPEGLEPSSSAWDDLAHTIRQKKPDALVTNEMPFGAWLCDRERYDDAAAAEWVAAHDHGLEALRALGVRVVLSSRPVQCAGRLANEGFVLIDGQYTAVHHKQLFPDEPGFFEAEWFRAGRDGFEVADCAGLVVGFMICTEVMFNEWARHYRRQGCQLIVVPRATEASHRRWLTAASMAAIVSGCYVVSSNRVGPVNADMSFGGHGFAFAPNGELLATTSAAEPVLTIDLDPAVVARQQAAYPCYVREPQWGAPG